MRLRPLTLALTGCLAGSLLGAPRALAQSEESEGVPAPGMFEADPLPAPDQPFFVPDVFHTRLQWVY